MTQPVNGAKMPRGIKQGVDLQRFLELGNKLYPALQLRDTIQP